MTEQPAQAARAVVTISPSVATAIIAHAMAEMPRECCGLLVGRRDAVDDARTTVLSSVPTENLETGTSRFLINPAQHFALIRRLRGTDLEIVGAYHSHPRSAAVPSPSDLAEAWPDLICVIVSLAGHDAPDLRAYHVRGDPPRPIPLEITEDA